MKVFMILLITVIYASANEIEKGITFFNENKFMEASLVFENILQKDEENADAHFWLGSSQLRINKIDEAVESLETAIELKDNVAEYYFRYGQALGVQVQSASIFKQAFIAGDILEAYEKTVELDESHIGGHVGLANFYLRAPSLMGGDIEKAKKEVAILNKLGSKEGKLIEIGIFVQEDKFKEAENSYDEFHKNFDDSNDNPVFYNGYGYFLLQQKKLEKAIKMFQRQAELRPGSANSFDSLGDGLRAAGKLKEALEAYKKAVIIDPGFEASVKNVKELEEELKQ